MMTCRCEKDILANCFVKVCFYQNFYIYRVVLLYPFLIISSMDRYIYENYNSIFFHNDYMTKENSRQTLWAKSSGFVRKIKPRPLCHMFDVKVDHDFEVNLKCDEKLMSSKTPDQLAYSHMVQQLKLKVINGKIKGRNSGF